MDLNIKYINFYSATYLIMRPSMSDLIKQQLFSVIKLKEWHFPKIGTQPKHRS